MIVVGVVTRLGFRDGKRGRLYVNTADPIAGPTDVLVVEADVGLLKGVEVGDGVALHGRLDSGGVFCAVGIECLPNPWGVAAWQPLVNALLGDEEEESA